MLKKIVLFSFISIFLLSCGAYNAGAISRAERSYIKFTGDPTKVTIVIDEGSPITLSLDDFTVYETTPGKHNLKAYRNKDLIINRVVFLENQGTMEITLP